MATTPGYCRQDSNFLLKLIVQCSRCCVWCLERTIQFITYFGFVFVAIEGTLRLEHSLLSLPSLP